MISLTVGGMDEKDQKFGMACAVTEVHGRGCGTAVVDMETDRPAASDERTEDSGEVGGIVEEQGGVQGV